MVLRVCVFTLAFVLAGCATLQPVVVSKGHGLVTVSVQPPEAIQAVCQNPRALACVPSRADGVTIFFRLPPDTWGIEQAELTTLTEVVTHELCHATYRVVVQTFRALRPYLDLSSENLSALVANFARDPCHDEDGGVLK